MKPLAPVIGALLLAAVPLAGQTSLDSAPSDPPPFEEAPCPFEAPAEVLDQVRCGYVTVPENRDAPGGRRLRLAVAIVGSLGPDPRPDPMVVIQGGPGQKLVEYAPGMIRSGAMDRFRADREVVLYDQRGTGYSEPRFCPSLNAELQRISRVGLSPGERLERQRSALAGCRKEMLREGVDLARYNSPANAADLADLRKALGYAEWNLVAASYGTRAALTAMRLSPEGIRSVVLDGPVPPSEPQWAYRGVGITDVMRRLSERCAGDPACDAAWPDVEGTFWSGVEELARAPLVLPVPDDSADSLVIDGNLYATAIWQALYSRRSLPMVPMLVHGLRSRNEAVAADVAGRLLSQPPDQTSMGLQFTVACYDDAPLNTPEARARYGGGVGALELTDAQTDPSLCTALHPFRSPPEHLRPVANGIPTLIFTGEFDPTTHRSRWPVVARTLRNAQLVEIPDAGHTESLASPCTQALMLAFLDEPGKPLDTACLASLPPLRFRTDP
jgi:pimeloyl-ACP methyl ester carboxylesterase